jgi:hypothetical protein
MRGVLRYGCLLIWVVFWQLRCFYHVKYIVNDTNADAVANTLRAAIKARGLSYLLFNGKKGKDEL